MPVSDSFVYAGFGLVGVLALAALIVATAAYSRSVVDGVMFSRQEGSLVINDAQTGLSVRIAPGKIADSMGSWTSPSVSVSQTNNPVGMGLSQVAWAPGSKPGGATGAQAFTASNFVSTSRPFAPKSSASSNFYVNVPMNEGLSSS